MDGDLNIYFQVVVQPYIGNWAVPCLMRRKDEWIFAGLHSLLNKNIYDNSLRNNFVSKMKKIYTKMSQTILILWHLIAFF